MNYEETFEKLEKTISEMESNDINLDEMMEKYKMALDLYKDLEQYLDNYKKEIKIVTEKGLENFNEEFSEE